MLYVVSFAPVLFPAVDMTHRLSLPIGSVGHVASDVSRSSEGGLHWTKLTGLVFK